MNNTWIQVTTMLFNLTANVPFSSCPEKYIGHSTHFFFSDSPFPVASSTLSYIISCLSRPSLSLSFADYSFFPYLYCSVPGYSLWSPLYSHSTDDCIMFICQWFLTVYTQAWYSLNLHMQSPIHFYWNRHPKLMFKTMLMVFPCIFIPFTSSSVSRTETPFVSCPDQIILDIFSFPDSHQKFRQI